MGVKGGGNLGKLMENTPAKVAFDTNTGAVTIRKTSPDGNASSETMLIPNDQLTDLGQYITTLSQNMKAGTNQNPGVYPVTANMMAFDAIGTQVGAEVIGQASTGYGGSPEGAKILPMVTAWQIKNPPVRAVVYTDKAGVSKFLYKNDPGNVVQLVKNGSKVAGGVKQAAGPSADDCNKARQILAACSATPAAGTSTYAAQDVVYPIQVGGYPMWVVILSIASIVAALVMAKKSG
jgi:hypothetical protein